MSDTSSTASFDSRDLSYNREVALALPSRAVPIMAGPRRNRDCNRTVLEAVAKQFVRLSHYRTDSGGCVEVSGADLPQRERRAIILGHGPGGLLEHVLHLVRRQSSAGRLLHERNRSDDMRRRHRSARRARVVSKVSEAAWNQTALLQVVRGVEEVQRGPGDGARRDDVRAGRSQRRVELRAAGNAA